MFNKSVTDLASLISHREFVIARICKNNFNIVELVNGDTLLEETDIIFVITIEQAAGVISTFFGEEISMERKQCIPEDNKLNS